MKQAILALIMLIFILPPAKADFSLGANFTVTMIDGYVQVTCRSSDRQEEAIKYWCRDSVLEPSAYDYFIGPNEVHADTVYLSAQSEDGSTRTKIQDYDSRARRTEDPVNLWINTPFQKPLLKEGKNNINYELYGRESKVFEGEFVVNVVRGQPRQCPVEVVESTNMIDCRSQYSICQSYFYRHHNCR